MNITDTRTQDEHEVVIEPATSEDMKAIKNNKEFSFKWHTFKGEVFKLRLKNENVILGLIHITPYPQEKYLFLQLNHIEVGKTNVGSKKHYDKIAGCLIAYACRLSFVKNCTGVVMLVAKTKIAKIYQSKYGFEFIGNFDSLGDKMMSDYDNSNKLIKMYLE